MGHHRIMGSKLMIADFRVELDTRLLTITDENYDFSMEVEPPEGVVAFQEEDLPRHMELFLKMRQRYLENLVDKKLNNS